MMNPCKRPSLFFLLSVLFVCQSSAFSSDFQYKKRAEGSSAERFEGVLPDQTAGGLTLLSFIKIPAFLDNASSLISVSFRTPAPILAYMSVVELDKRHSYRLDVSRTQWDTDLNEFSWSTRDVLEPLNIPRSNLGFLVSERRYGGSGTIYPALINSSNAIKNTAGYEMKLRTKTTCSPLVWVLLRSSDNQLVTRKIFDNVPVETVKSISFDMSQAQADWYKIVIKCNREGFGAGSGGDEKRTYSFPHYR